MPPFDDLTAPLRAQPTTTDRTAALLPSDLLEWADALDAAGSPQMASALRSAADPSAEAAVGMARPDR